MQKLKQIQKWIPELYLLFSAICYWVATSTLFNPVGICLVALLLALFTWKTKTLGIIVSLLFLILSLYMVLALVSEISHFSTFNTKAKVMLAVSGTWLGLNILLASMMLIKWGRDRSFYSATINPQTILFP